MFLGTLYVFRDTLKKQVVLSISTKNSWQIKKLCKINTMRARYTNMFIGSLFFYEGGVIVAKSCKKRFKNTIFTCDGSRSK